MQVKKSKAAFRTIAEVSTELGLASHVLRFWETKFPQLQPMKRAGGRRYYRPDDVTLLHVIKDFLYNQRYTIEGLQKVFDEQGVKKFLGEKIQKDFFSSDEFADACVNQELIKNIISELTHLKDEANVKLENI